MPVVQVLKRLFIIVFLPLPLFSCASTGTSSFQSGELKNSLPFADKELIARTHSVVILPFYGDKAGWKKTSFDVMSLSTRISLIQPEQYEKFLKGQKKDLLLLTPEERPAVVSEIGRALNADAALNGVVLTKGDKQEVILQLVLSRDSRILWWQATELGPEAPSGDDIRNTVSRMLTPLMNQIGTKDRQEAAVRHEGPSAEKAEYPSTTAPPSKPDSPQSDGQRPRSDRKTDKKPRPHVNDVSPM